MALSTYSDLTGAVASWLHRSDLTSQIPDFITLAESRLYNRLRVRQMETTSANTMASGVIAVPTNYVELKDAYISSTTPFGRLERKTTEWIYDRYPDRTSTRQPAYIAREGTNFIFGPFPDSNYTVTLDFWNKFPALSSATNAIWTSYPGLWLYGALLEAAPYLKNDARVPLWKAAFDEMISSIQTESDREYASGGSLQIESDIPQIVISGGTGVVGAP